MSGSGGLLAFTAIATVMAVAAGLLALPPRQTAGVDATTLGSGSGWRRIGVMLMLPAAAALLYLRLGDPAALNAERAELSQQLRHPGQPLDAAAMQQFENELERQLARHPDDARARVMQARLDLRAQRVARAVEHYARALEGRSKTTGDAGVWVEYAEALGLAQGGTLTGRPRELVAKALALDPGHAPALDLAGSAAWEAGDYALAATHWRQLLAQIAPADPRHAQLQAAIARAEQRARFALPGPR